MLERAVGVDTDALRTSADTSVEEAQKFLQKYDALKDAVEHSTMTGPVYEAALRAINEKQAIVDEIRGTLQENADYSEERADAGDKLIRDLSDGMR